MANFVSNLFRSNKKLTVDEFIVKKTITSFFFLQRVSGRGSGCVDNPHKTEVAVIFTRL